MAYTDEEINIMARQLVEASHGGGGLEGVLGVGTDDKKFQDIMGRVSGLEPEEKQRVVTGIDNYLRQEGVDNNGYTSLRDMIKGEFSNVDAGDGEEDAAMQAFGLARDDVFGQDQDEIMAGEGEDDTVDFNRPTELPKIEEVNKREPEPPAEDDFEAQNAQKAKEARAEGNDPLADFLEGKVDDRKIIDVPADEQMNAPAQKQEMPELEPMEVQDKAPEDFFNFKGLNTSIKEGPDGPAIHTTKPFDIPELGPAPQKQIATPEMLAENPAAQQLLNLQHTEDLRQHNQQVNQAMGLKAMNEQMKDKAEADNAAALQPQAFQAPNFQGGDKDFNDFKVQVAERQWRDQQNERLKANEALMQHFQELNPASDKFDSRYRGMAEWYANQSFADKKLSEMTPMEAIALKKRFREDIQNQAIARANANAPKLYTDEDVEKALKEQGAMQVAEDDGRGGVTTRWMQGDQFDDWNASRGMPTRDQMQNDGANVFTHQELKPEHGVRPGSGVMGDWQGNVDPRDPFRNPAAPEVPGLPTPEEQAEMQVAQKHGMTVEELRQRRANPGMSPALRAYTNLETDKMPPEIEQLYLNNQAITDAQQKVDQIGEAINMAKEIEAGLAQQNAVRPLEDVIDSIPQTLMDAEGIPYDESGPTDIYNGPLQDPRERFFQGPEAMVTDAPERMVPIIDNPEAGLTPQALSVPQNQQPMEEFLMDLEGIPYDESGPLDMDFEEELRRRQHAPGSVGAFFDNY